LANLRVQISYKETATAASFLRLVLRGMHARVLLYGFVRRIYSLVALCSQRQIHEQTRWPKIKQDASAAVNEYIKNYHAQEEEENSSKETAKLNVCMAALQYQPKINLPL
jgi:hypothetical protein